MAGLKLDLTLDIASKITSSATFDPATLALTAWWRAGNYNSSTGTWSGQASAGSSGSHDATQGSPPSRPPDGTSLNGHTTVQFGLIGGSFVNLAGGSMLSTYFSAAAGSSWALINATSEDTDSAPTAPYSNDAVWGDTAAVIGMHLRSTGPKYQSFVDDTGFAVNCIETVFSNGTWTLLKMTWDGSHMKAGINSTAMTSTTCANVNGGAGTLKVGVNYIGNAPLTGYIAEIGMIDASWTDSDFSNIVSYINTRYGLSL